MQPRASPSRHGPGEGRVIRAAALGLTLVVTVLLTGCGIVVTDEAPTDILRASAPALLSAFPEVEALAPAPTRTLSLGRARRIARRAALQIRIPACDDDALGRGFALDSHTLIAHHDVLPGGGWVRVQPRTVARPRSAPRAPIASMSLASPASPAHFRGGFRWRSVRSSAGGLAARRAVVRPGNVRTFVTEAGFLDVVLGQTAPAATPISAAKRPRSRSPPKSPSGSRPSPT